MSRPSWGHTPRKCLRCGRVGPRVSHGGGYIHAYCRTDDEKKALREKMAAARKDWYAAMKSHREEVGKRIKEIREEFKNNRDKVIDGNDPGE